MAVSSTPTKSTTSAVSKGASVKTKTSKNASAAAKINGGESSIDATAAVITVGLSDEDIRGLISAPGLKRLLRRSGCPRAQAAVYDVARKYMVKATDAVLKGAHRSANHGKRVTIIPRDVNFSINNQINGCVIGV